MPGGGYSTVKIELPKNWDALMAERGYRLLSEFQKVKSVVVKPDGRERESRYGFERNTIDKEEQLREARQFLS